MTNILSTMQIAGVHLPWQMVLAGVVAAQFAIIALITVFAPIRMRKALAVSTAVFAAGWLFAFDASSLMGNKATTADASTMGVTKHQGSCASIQNDMSAAEVRRRLGQPDETRNDEIVRGPGSVVLIYRDLRCAVHLFDEKVELVD